MAFTINEAKKQLNLSVQLEAEEKKLKKNLTVLRTILDKKAVSGVRDNYDEVWRDSVYTAGEELFNLFSKQSRWCWINDLEKLNKKIEASINLLKAEPGLARQEALETYLQVALPTHCLGPEQDKNEAGIKMLKLGLVLLGFTALMITCMALHFWPLIPILITIFPSISEGGTVAVPADVMIAGIISSVVCGVGGLAYFLCGIKKVCEARHEISKLQKEDASIKGKVDTFAAFFQPGKSNEIIQIPLLSSQERCALDTELNALESSNP